jgi:hypothetical protein
MVRGINDPQLRTRALERQIDLVRGAVKRARATWMGAMVITFVIAATIFNATMNWNRGQIERRTQLVSVAAKDLDGIWKDVHSMPVLKAALVDGAGELAYLRYLLPPEGSDRELPQDEINRRLEAFRHAVKTELDEQVRRGKDYDTTEVPFIRVPISASDIGIVGGLAVSIIGFWLLATLRRENHALGEFIRRPDYGRNFDTDFSGYRPEESIHAYRSVAHEMVFSVSDKESILNYATIGSFIAPPALLLVNHMLTAVMLFRRGIGDYVEAHCLLELAVVVVVTSIWVMALVYQMRTLDALQAWAGIVDKWGLADIGGLNKVSRVSVPNRPTEDSSSENSSGQTSTAGRRATRRTTARATSHANGNGEGVGATSLKLDP